MKPRTPTAVEIVYSLDKVIGTRTINKVSEDSSPEPLCLPLLDYELVAFRPESDRQNRRPMLGRDVVTSVSNSALRIR